MMRLSVYFSILDVCLNHEGSESWTTSEKRGHSLLSCINGSIISPSAPPSSHIALVHTLIVID